MKTTIQFYGHPLTVAQPGDATTPITITLGNAGNLYVRTSLVDSQTGRNHILYGWSGDLRRALHAVGIYSYARTDAAGLALLQKTGHIGY